MADNDGRAYLNSTFATYPLSPPIISVKDFTPAVPVMNICSITSRLFPVRTFCPLTEPFKENLSFRVRFPKKLTLAFVIIPPGVGPGLVQSLLGGVLYREVALADAARHHGKEVAAEQGAVCPPLYAKRADCVVPRVRRLHRRLVVP